MNESVKAKDKKVQQYLLHAKTGETIGELNECNIVAFERGNDKGYLAINKESEIVLALFSRPQRFFIRFNADFETNEEKLKELSEYLGE